MPISFTATDHGEGTAQSLPLGHAIAAQARAPIPWPSGGGYRPPWQRGGGGGYGNHAPAPPLEFRPIEPLDVEAALRDRFQVADDTESDEEEDNDDTGEEEEEDEPTAIEESIERATSTRVHPALKDLIREPNDETRAKYKETLFVGYKAPDFTPRTE